MATTVSPQDAVPPADETAIPLVPQDEKDSHDALAKLADVAARATADLRPASVADFSAGPRVAAPAVESVHAPRADEKVETAPMPPPRRGGGNPLRFVLAVGIGVAATLAWQSYGQSYEQTARQMIAAYAPAIADLLAPVVPPASIGAGSGSEQAMVAPHAEVASPLPTVAAGSSSPVVAPLPPELTQQIESMARDLAALRDTMAKVGAGQDQIARTLARLQEADDDAHRAAAARPIPVPTPSPVRRTVAPPPRPSAPPPVTAAAPRPTPQTVTATPLPLASSPPVPPPPANQLPEPPRRPPASMP
jgi:hypothetical protein